MGSLLRLIRDLRTSLLAQLRARREIEQARNRCSVCGGDERKCNLKWKVVDCDEMQRRDAEQYAPKY